MNPMPNLINSKENFDCYTNGVCHDVTIHDDLTKHKVEGHTLVISALVPRRHPPPKKKNLPSSYNRIGVIS